MAAFRSKRLLIVVPGPDDKPLASPRKAKVRRYLAAHAIDDTPRLTDLKGSADLKFFAFLADEPAYVGFVCAHWDEKSGVANLGFDIQEKFRRRGFGSELVAAAAPLLMECKQIRAIKAETFADYPAAIKLGKKAGLSPVDTDLGPNLIRLGWVRPGESIDLTEKPALSLLPIRSTPIKAGLDIFKWHWDSAQMLLPVIILGLATFRFANYPVAPFIAAAFVGMLIAFISTWFKWMPSMRTETLLQFRESGLFYMDRSGYGGIYAWTNYPVFRARRDGGLDLWAGDDWYRIPASAFTPALRDQAIEFLHLAGVEPYDPTKFGELLRKNLY